MSLPLVQMMHPPHSILHVLPEVEKGVAVDNSRGMSSPSSVRHSEQGTPPFKQTGMSLNLGIVQGSVFFRVCWIFSPPLILAPLNHSLCQSIPWFPFLCCCLNFCFFHSFFQMVEGSCLQTARRRNLQQLGAFSR